jgi:hypothetical protein
MSMFKKKKSRFADRGKEAENATQDYLEWWQERSAYREFNRLPDTKAAGRTIKAAPADFEFYHGSPADDRPTFGLIEVKETQHEYRLERDKVTQLARLRKRSKCGGKCPVLVHHSTIDKWRIVLAPQLMEFGDKGSWNLSGFELFDSPDAALHDLLPDVFELKE